MTCIMWSWWRSHRDERTGTLRIARIQRTMNALSLDWKLYESTDGGARKIKHFQQDKITIFWYFNKIRTSVSQQALFRHNKHTETKKMQNVSMLGGILGEISPRIENPKPCCEINLNEWKPAKEGHTVTPKSVIGEASEAENSLASPGHGRQETTVQSMHKTKIIHGKEL